MFLLFLLFHVSLGQEEDGKYDRTTLVPPKHKPFGMRLFLTKDPNKLNLYWNCRGYDDVESNDFVKGSSVNISYSGKVKPTEVRWANDGTKVSYSKRADHLNTYLQFNTTVNLDTTPNSTNKLQVSYTVSCYNTTSHKHKIHYKHWEDSQEVVKDIWTVAAAGSVGTFLNVNKTISTISWLAGQSNNLLWVIPGGVLTDSTTNSLKEVFDEWLLWLQIVDKLTCCVPLVAAPSELDLSLDEELFHYFLPQPVQEKSHWYSFDHRNMHMVVTCAHCDLNTTSPQYRWLNSDLKASTQRSGVHWTTLIGHESRHHQGDPGKVVLDELANEYNVDFAVWSHERWYERSQPMRRAKVTKYSGSSVLKNVNGTIHYTCGTGGSPLSIYNMTKYNDSAYFEQRYYGACLLQRVSYSTYDSAFFYIDPAKDTIQQTDFIQIKKEGVKPPDFEDGHFSRFMKIFGIVLLGGASVMILLTLVIKIIQERDPSFIPNKIRNIPRWIRYSRRSQGEQIELEDDPNNADMTTDEGYDGDKVMLIEEDEDTLQRQADIQSTQLIHCQIR